MSEEKLVPKLRFSGFDEDWIEINIKDYSTIKGRIGWKNLKQSEYTESGPYLIAGKHITNGIINWDECDHLSMERYDESPEIALKTGDVIFSKDGSLGNPALIRELPDKATINGTMMLVRLHDKVTPNFFYQVLNSYSFLRLLHILKSGSSIPHIFQRDMENFKFKIPQSLTEQNQISSFLEVVDEKIELLKQKQKQYENFKKYLMQQIFAQKLRFDFEGEWDEKYVKDIFDITRGDVIAKTLIKDVPDENYCYPVFSSQTTNKGIMGYFNDYDFDGEYITWTTDGANAGKTVYRNGKFKCSNVCGVLKAKSEFTGFANPFIAEYLDSITYRYVSYVGNPKLMNNIMAKIKIKFPPLEEQQKISKLFESVYLSIDIIQNKKENVEKFKKGLLQQMFV